MATLEELMPAFLLDLREVGVPFATGSSVPVSIRTHPQMVPVLLDWIANYRERIEPRAWYRFAMVCQGAAKGWGEPHPELANAFIQEYRRLVEVDFEKLPPYENGKNRGSSTKVTLIGAFSFGIADVAGAENHGAIRRLILDPLAWQYSSMLIHTYLAKSKAKDVPEIIGEALKSSDLNIYRNAARVAGLRGYTQFRDQVQKIADDCAAEPEIDFYWRDPLNDAAYKLSRKIYADAHKNAESSELLKDLGNEATAAFAAYVLGARKEAKAAEPLRALTTSKTTRARQEAKAALKKIEKAHGPS